MGVIISVAGVATLIYWGIIASFVLLIFGIFLYSKLFNK